jgi:hypothetical protein
LEQLLLELLLLEQLQLELVELEQLLLELVELEQLELEQLLLELVELEHPLQLERLPLGLVAMTRQSPLTRPAAALIGVTAGGAIAALAVTAPEVGTLLANHLGAALAFLAATVGLQLCSLKVPGKGSIGVSAVAVIAAAATLGTGPAMALGSASAVVQLVRTHGVLHRAVFDAGNLVLAAGAAGLIDGALIHPGSNDGARFLAATLGGLAYVIVNHALLLAAMSTDEKRSPTAIWRQRFHWARGHLLLLGPAAALVATIHSEIGSWALLPLIALALPLARSLRYRLQQIPPRGQVSSSG